MNVKNNLKHRWLRSIDLSNAIDQINLESKDVVPIHDEDYKNYLEEFNDICNDGITNYANEKIKNKILQLEYQMCNKSDQKILQM